MIKLLEKKTWLSLSFLILIAIEIFLFSNLEGVSGIKIPLLSEVYHFIVFFLFGFFLIIFIKGEKNMKNKYFFLALAISILYALSDEFHQFFTPNRTASIWDFLVDIFGVCIGMFVYLTTLKNQNSTQ